MSLPQNKMYALRHGVTGKIWTTCSGGRWLWPSVESMKKSWNTLKEAGLVGSEFEEHEVVVINLF